MRQERACQSLQGPSDGTDIQFLKPSAIRHPQLQNHEHGVSALRNVPDCLSASFCEYQIILLGNRVRGIRMQ